MSLRRRRLMVALRRPAADPGKARRQVTNEEPITTDVDYHANADARSAMSSAVGAGEYDGPSTDTAGCKGFYSKGYGRDLFSSSDVGKDVMFAFLLYHDPEWNIRSHFGMCGQSCGCCRSHNPEDAGPDCNCEACYTGWVLTTISSGFKRFVQRQAVILKLCRCGRCHADWIAAGWQCPRVGAFSQHRALSVADL